MFHVVSCCAMFVCHYMGVDGLPQVLLSTMQQSSAATALAAQSRAQEVSVRKVEACAAQTRADAELLNAQATKDAQAAAALMQSKQLEMMQQMMTQQKQFFEMFMASGHGGPSGSSHNP